MKLRAGQRYPLTNDTEFARLESGNCEIYAVTRRKISYRQEFLMEWQPGQAAFSAYDEFGYIDILIYAVEDSVIQITPVVDMEPAEFLPLMREWFQKMVALPWLKVLADRGDDMVIPWRRGNVLSEHDDSAMLIKDFIANEQIFSMLLGVRFQSEDKKLSQRIKLRDQQQQRIVDASINNLLGKEVAQYEDMGESNPVAETAYIVRQVARAFNMPTEVINLDPNIVKKLKPDQIIRRLIQKGNMQMRMVTLEGKWYKADCGVFIGYYGEQHEMAAILPTAPGKYKIVTQNCPEGIVLDETTEPLLYRKAFACYAGFPSRRLKLMDLIKFMFQKCWRRDYWVIIMASLVGGIIPLVMPIITETIFQDIIPIQDRQGLATIVQVMMVTSFSTAALNTVRSVAVMRITTQLDISTEAALWIRILSLPTKFFRQFQMGELASRMAGIEVVKGIVNGEFVGTLFGLLFSFWSLFLMCWYSIKLTAAAIAIWLVYCIINAFIYRRVIGFQRQSVQAGNKTAGMV